MKIKKGIPLIDQHDKNGFYGGKFGGNYVAETLKKPIDDLTKLFKKYRKDKNFLKERDNLYENYVGKPTRFIKLQNLTDHLDGAQIYSKMVSEANGGAHKIYNAITHAMLCKRAKKKYEKRTFTYPTCTVVYSYSSLRVVPPVWIRGYTR